MSAHKRALPFLPIMITDDETSHRVATSFGKRSFETPTQQENSPPKQQLQDETENHALKPSFVLKPKRQKGTILLSSMEQPSHTLFSSSPHCFQPTRRTPRSPVLMPSSIQHFNRGEKFHHSSRPRLLPRLPQECDGHSNMMRPQEFLTFRRTSLPQDLEA
jgi:hypothetical protein